MENQINLLGLTVDTRRIKNQRIEDAIQRLNGHIISSRYRACPFRIV